MSGDKREKRRYSVSADIKLTVDRNGISYGFKWYYNVKLLPYRDAEVFVRKEKDCLKVFNLNGKLICKAKATDFHEAARQAKERNHVSV